MKRPSTSIAKSLLTQRAGGRDPEPINVSEMRGVRWPSMVAPGEGGVVPAPGEHLGGRAERSAAVFCKPMQKYGGGE